MSLKNFVKGLLHGSTMYSQSMIDDRYINDIDHLKAESASFINGDVIGGLTMASAVLYGSYKFYSPNNYYSIISSAITFLSGAKIIYDTSIDALDFIGHKHHHDIDISGSMNNNIIID